MNNEMHALFEETLSYLLAPVQTLLADEGVTEIMINGPAEIFAERAGRIERTPLVFADDAALEAAARGIAQFSGKRLTADQLSVEARLPDGSRVHIVQPPAARKGLSMAIRKFSRSKLGLADLVKRNALTEEAAAFLTAAVRIRKNIIVSGGTGSGKTTLLNCLSAQIPSYERILVIEDTSELQLQQDHVVQLEAQQPDRFGQNGISIRELFRASLRMRPDRILVGECRGGEALDMIQAMTSGHSGSLSTCHADTPNDTLARLEVMCLMSGVELPLMALRAQVASAVQLIVQVGRQADGSRRITEIAQVRGLDENHRYVIDNLFRLTPGTAGPSLVWSGVKPTFAQTVTADPTLGELVKASARLWSGKNQ